MKNRYEINLEFMPTSRNGIHELKSIRLKTKPITWKRAQEIADTEIEQSGWPESYVKATIRTLSSGAADE